MKKRFVHFQSPKILAVALIALLAGGWLAVGPAAAAGDLDKLDTSLKLIPANAAFYSSMLRNREQIDAIINSHAWAKIMAMPSVQMAKAMFEAQAQQPGTPAAQGMAALQNPETKKLIDLAMDMGSNEVFFYGDKDFVDFAKLLQRVVSALRYQPAILEMTGEGQGVHSDKLQAKAVLEALIQNRDLLYFPDIVIGFRLNNPDAAKEALIKLETILNLTLEAQPMLKGHFKKEKVGNYEYLVLRLDGKMVPWDELPLDEFKELVDDQSDWDKLLDHLKQMNFVLALGLRENCLLVSIGSSLDCINSLGSGQRLIDRPEFVPLGKFVDQRLVGIGYLSRELNAQLNNNAQQIDDLRDFLTQILPLANLPDEQSEKIEKDLGSLADDLKSTLPKLGAIMAFEFMTPSGLEGYRYNWGDHFKLVSTEPLSLLNHVGGNPLLGVISRSKVSIKDYDTFAKWVTVGGKYVEELLLPNIPDEERGKAQAFFKDLTPLLKRLNAAVRDKLLPSLADGQVGLVIDAKLKTKQLIGFMPPFEKEMPMVEPALLFGVSDADLLRQAVGEIYTLANDFLDLIRKHQPGSIPPDFKLPPAKLVQKSEGAIYSYPFPEGWGVDDNIVPNAGLSKNVAVLTLSPQQTRRLLKVMPLKVGGVLSQIDKPMAIAGWLDVSEVIGAATPWVQYILEQIPPEEMGGQKELIVAQVKTVLEVLRVVKSLTSESYLENNCLVTHSKLEIHDLSN
jgi:hypothetical protein